MKGFRRNYERVAKSALCRQNFEPFPSPPYVQNFSWINVWLISPWQIYTRFCHPEFTSKSFLTLKIEIPKQVRNDKIFTRQHTLITSKMDAQKMDDIKLLIFKDKLVWEIKSVSLICSIMYGFVYNYGQFFTEEVTYKCLRGCQTNRRERCYFE